MSHNLIVSVPDITPRFHSELAELDYRGVYRKIVIIKEAMEDRELRTYRDIV